MAARNDDDNNDSVYSWMREAINDVDDDNDERFSQTIADTVGGRTRAQLEEHRQGGSQRLSTGISDTSAVITSMARRIEQHPEPGSAARRLLEMVQQPFCIKYGSDGRALSSAREIELQRAGSSTTKPPFTPFKDVDPVILDSPRRTPVAAHSIGTQTQPVTPPSLHRRSHSLSDYPPLYDFSYRPASSSHFRHSSLGSYRTATLDPNYYQKRHINTLLADIRRNKELVRKLDGRYSELDKECRRDIDELDLIRQKRELEVRKLEQEMREREFFEHTRNTITTHQPQPILKHSASFPPNPSNGIVNNNTRVNFANPICTAKEYTPNNSVRTISPPRATVNSNREREQGQNRVAHEAEFRAVQQRASVLSATQRRGAAASRRGGRSTVYRGPSNQSSIFHFVPDRC